jgi:hypothetical protein
MAINTTDVKILQPAIVDLDEIPGEPLPSLRKHDAAPVRKSCPSKGRKSCGRRKSCRARKSCP